MDPATVSMIAGGASSAANIWSAERANKTNIALSREQMQFQERMSSTAHQREVADLRKAGLNPVLSAGGSGASSPSGSQANVTPFQVEDLGQKFASAKLLKEDLVNRQADTRLKASSSAAQDATKDVAIKELKKKDAEIERERQQTQLLRTENRMRGQEADWVDKNKSWYTPMKNVLPLIQQGTGSINNIMDSFNPFKKIGKLFGSDNPGNPRHHNLP